MELIGPSFENLCGISKKKLIIEMTSQGATYDTGTETLSAKRGVKRLGGSGIYRKSEGEEPP